MKRIKVKIKQPQKCYRFFYDDAGQGFTPPCCRMTDKNGNVLREYYTFVECEGNVNQCPFVQKILEARSNNCGKTN